MDHVNLSFKVFQAFFDAGNLDEFIEETSRLIGNPMIVVGSGFKLLASSQAKDIPGASFWSDAVRSGAFGDKLIEEVIGDHCWDMHITTNEPYERDHSDGPYKWLISKLVFREQLFGTVVILEVNPMPAGIWKLLPIISNLVVKMLLSERGDIIFNDDRTYETVFMDLLLGNVHPGSPFHNRIISDKLGSGKYFQLLTIPVSDGIRSSAGNLKHTFASLLPGSWLLFYEDCLQILRTLDSPDPDILRYREQLMPVLEQYNTVLCCSDTFTDLSGLPRYREQSLRSLEIKDLLGRKDRILLRENYRFFDMALSAADYDEKVLDGFLSEKIREIRKYDEENGTDYFRTLSVYLESKESSTLAAKKLFTHRNTILYRIGKIRELFNLDLESEESWFRLLYSCMVASLQDELRGRGPLVENL